MANLSPRPTLEQVNEMLAFMEKHPALALGKMKGLEARAESKRLWLQLSKSLNAMPGPAKPTKSWIKFWSDKKSNVKIKVHAAGGDVNSLMSNVERKIWDKFLSEEALGTYTPGHKDTVKEEPSVNESNLLESEIEESVPDPEFEFQVQSIVDYEERQVAIMEKLVQVMGAQATAMSQLAQSATVSAKAMDRLAESSLIQARAIERLSHAFDGVSSSTLDVRNAIVDIDDTMKRFYSTPT